ncbi:hypothetical protein EOPP23_09270 [Endozoicomonas sp. OPT23]|uniref:hypothetical protein n=1 Tax=Endozoicomonas sp. OPT23 TaxID=2072845 RepID=UPI00129B8E51|nr:hypothetical protein [Endozoicomonas sp. OPT23]MRI33172.1 hypothetical protein [Endozoicomonas sp. OPT23]
MKTSAVLLVAASLSVEVHSHSFEVFDSALLSNWNIELPAGSIPDFHEGSAAMVCTDVDCQLSMHRTSRPFIKILRSATGMDSGHSILIHRPEIHLAASQQTHSLIKGTAFPNSIRYDSYKPLTLSPVLVISSSSETWVLLNSPVYHWLVIDSALHESEISCLEYAYTLESNDILQVAFPPEKSHNDLSEVSHIQLTSSSSGKISLSVPGQEPPSDSGNGKKEKENWFDSSSDESDTEASSIAGKSKQSQGMGAGAGGDKPPRKEFTYKRPLPADAAPHITLEEMTPSQLVTELKKSVHDQSRIEQVIRALITKCQKIRAQPKHGRDGNKALREVRGFIIGKRLFIDGKLWTAFTNMIL